MIPLQMLLACVLGWLEAEQRDVIPFLREENRVLKAQLGRRRLRMDDDQRRRLAVLGQRLGRALMHEMATLVTPDTIRRWHRELIARKWTYARQRPGRPGVLREIRRLVLRMATENPRWGYTRIQGALKNVGHQVARSTIAAILKAEGIPPSGERPSPWRTFLRAHWPALVAADFFTTEVWTGRGLVTYYTLFVIELQSRRVQVVGATRYPDEAFVLQAMRHLTDGTDGLLGPRPRVDLRSRSEVERGSRGVPGTGGRPDHSDASPSTELQRLRGAIRSLDQRRVPESHDRTRRVPPPACPGLVRGALPRRTKPPRSRQRVDSAATANGCLRSRAPAGNRWVACGTITPGSIGRGCNATEFSDTTGSSRLKHKDPSGRNMSPVCMPQLPRDPAERT